jgi:hypothetical protein
MRLAYRSQNSWLRDNAIAKLSSFPQMRDAFQSELAAARCRKRSAQAEALHPEAVRRILSVERETQIAILDEPEYGLSPSPREF